MWPFKKQPSYEFLYLSMAEDRMKETKKELIIMTLALRYACDVISEYTHDGELCHDYTYYKKAKQYYASQRSR